MGLSEWMQFLCRFDLLLSVAWLSPGIPLRRTNKRTTENPDEQARSKREPLLVSRDSAACGIYQKLLLMQYLCSGLPQSSKGFIIGKVLLYSKSKIRSANLDRDILGKACRFGWWMERGWREMVKRRKWKAACLHVCKNMNRKVLFKLAPNACLTKKWGKNSYPMSLLWNLKYGSLL